MIIKKLKPVALYDSLHDIPQHNWEQFNITWNPNWLYKDPADKGRKVDERLLEAVYFQLYDEHSRLSGNDQFREKLIVLMRKIIKGYRKYAEGDLSQINRIEQWEEMKTQLLAGAQDADIIKTRMLVQKAYGMPIDPKKISAAEYLKICDIVKDLNVTEQTIAEDG